MHQHLVQLIECVRNDEGRTTQYFATPMTASEAASLAYLFGQSVARDDRIVLTLQQLEHEMRRSLIA